MASRMIQSDRAKTRASLMFIAGLALIVGAAFQVHTALGLFVLGMACVVIAIADRLADEREER